MEKEKQYNFIDLFAGCGGLSEGFLQTGKFCGLAHIEWEKPMIETLRNRLQTKWKESEEIARENAILFDIQKTDELVYGHWSDESIAKYGSNNSDKVINTGLKGIIGNKHVDMIIGGPPCQAYSIHGRATDKNSMNNDYRNYLFESFCKIVDSFQPELFVFENVAGLLSAKPGGIPVRQRIFDAFYSIGYEIKTPDNLKTALYNAVDFDVPQNRPRLIILGIKKGSDYNLDELYHYIDLEKSQKPYKTVKSAIGFLPPLYPLEVPIKKGNRTQYYQNNPDANITHHEARNHSPRDRQIFKEWIDNNMNYISHQAMIDYYYEKTGHRTLYQKYKNLEWDKPSHTVVAHLSKDGNMFIHPDSKQQRSITIREAACLMTFPLDFQFMGSNPYNFRMIGNAVPVNFAKHIANGIYKYLETKTK